MTADVVVAGGGPAGSVTALLLAQQGLSVILLERHRFPRRKPCGDCLSPAANHILQRLGLWDDVIHANAAQLTGWKLTSVGNESFSALFSAVTSDTHHHVALAIERERFDAILLAAARSAGVNVIEDARVLDVLREQGAVTGIVANVGGVVKHFRSKLTVGADGLRSIVARRLGAYARSPRLRKASFTMHIDEPVAAPIGEMRLGVNSCLGIAPVTRNLQRRNLTLVLNRGSFDARSGVRTIVARGLAHFGISLPPDTEIMASGPFDWPIKRPACPGAVLVGDAAGYYDPFTGQGIYQALAGAELVAAHTAEDLKTGRVRNESLDAYAAAHTALRGPTHKIQQIIEFVCARPRLGDWMFRKFSRDEVLARALVAATGDLIPPESLFSSRLLMRLAI
jgi:menaquinone-9 beta-reductase